ncbi:MAG: RsmB/NOP family class I SAM-dependent RNA methyltransferase [Rhodovibrionaceae bacterium]
MTPDARLQTVIELLEQVDSTGRPADRVVHDALRGRRYIGSTDRREVLERVFWQLRRKARLDWWLAELGVFIEPRARVLAALALCEDKNVAELAQLFDGQRYGPPKLGDKEKRWLKALEGQALDDPRQPEGVRGECPGWLYPRFGPQAEARLRALIEGAPLDLRVNELKADRGEAIERLRAEGIEAQPTPFSPLGLRLPGRVNLAETETFKKGIVEVQDEGSQIVSLLVAAESGQRVVDFCAGAGGKTLALAARMKNGGSIQALDIMQGRLDRAAQRAKRAGAHNIIRRLLKSQRDPWVKRQRRKADRVLIDAPCSGTGAWRRNPDARWNQTETGLTELIDLQAEILDSAWRMVKPGGRLIYATCSLLPEENERQVQAFLETHEDFTLLPWRNVWNAAIGTPPPEGEGEMLLLSPELHGTDGFFAAILQRKAEPPKEKAVKAEEAEAETAPE